MERLGRFVRTYLTRFNGSLPVSLEVLKKISYNRYELKIAHKIMNTKSLKTLKVGYRYWANFAQSMEGVIQVNSLKEKPALLQKEMEFLQLESWQILDDIALNGKSFLKDWILNSLEKTKLRSEFVMLTSMLLSLNEGIFHLPFKIDERPFLIQWIQKEEKSDENLVEFYFALDTLGAIKGTIGQEVWMRVLYEKSAKLLLEHESFSGQKLNIQISENMLYPLWEGDKGMLNVKA